METTEKTGIRPEAAFSIATDIAEAVAARGGRMYADLPFRDWMEKGYILETGEPYSFENHEYLIAIAEDPWPDKVVRKSAQVGATAMEIGYALYSCINRADRVIYYLPTDNFIPGHYKERVRELYNLSPYLDSMVRKPVAVTDNKFITGGMLYHRGLQAAIGVHSTPARILIFDEYDYANPYQAALALERTEHADFPEWHYIGTPTVAGFGVSGIYEKESDQRVWRVKCPGCGEWSRLLWLPDGGAGGVVEKVDDYAYEVKTDPPAVLCEFCDRALDRLAPGAWIPEFDGRKYHGYWISRLFSPRHTLAGLVDRFFRALADGDTEVQRFFNASLGLPYTAVGAELTAEDLDAVRGQYMPEIRSNVPAVAGIDVGTYNYYTVQEIGSGRILHAAATNWQGLNELFDRYNLVATVIDRLPETTQAKKLARNHPNVWLAEYPDDLGAVDVDAKTRDEVDAEGLDEEIKIVRINRTASIDRLVAAIRNGKGYALPANARELGRPIAGKPYADFYAQMLSNVRIYVEHKRTGVQRAIWRERGKDHYLHSGNYAMIARGLAREKEGGGTTGRYKPKRRDLPF